MFVLSACHRMPAAASDLAGRIACHSLLLLGLAVASGPAHAEVLRTFEFSRDANLTTQKWLDNRGYELQKHAQDPRRISLYHEGDDLHIVSKKPAFGMVIHEANIPDVTSVRLHWGVSDYPDGVSYERGIDNEAIMVYIFFGHEKLPSGEIFIPDSPYFIGFYLCEAGSDQAEQPYAGHHYAKTGRYICVDQPPEGELVVSELDLIEEFKKSFGVSTPMVVSGISIEVDTTDAENDGHAAAFLRRIEFYR